MTENGVWKISRTDNISWSFEKQLKKQQKDLEESFQTMADLWETYIQTAIGHDQLKAQHFET